MVGSETHIHMRLIKHSVQLPFPRHYNSAQDVALQKSQALPSSLWICQTQLIEGYMGQSTRQTGARATITGISFGLSPSLWGLADGALLHPEEPPCVTASPALSLEVPPQSALKFPNHTARKTVNSSEHFLQPPLLSFQACSALQRHRKGIRQASPICTCVRAAEERGQKDMRGEMRGRGFVLRVYNTCLPLGGAVITRLKLPL